MAISTTAAADPVAETHHEGLAERMARGPLTLEETLRYAIQVAACLRDVHSQGLIHGALTSHAILLSQSSLSLPASGGLLQLGDPHGDVKGFGAVLREMLAGLEASSWRDEIASLAARCEDGTPHMQHVVIDLRLVALRLHHASTVRRRSIEVAVPRIPVANRRPGRMRIRMSLHWRPLANLVALAFSGR